MVRAISTADSSSTAHVVDQPGGADPGRDQQPGRALRAGRQARVGELQVVDADAGDRQLGAGGGEHRGSVAAGGRGRARPAAPGDRLSAASRSSADR